MRRESDNNPRYEWFGEVPWSRARYADLCAVTPSFGGGSNVIPESIVLDTPVLASHVPDNVGLLGEDSPGLFAPKDQRSLADLLGAAGSWNLASTPNASEKIPPHFDTSVGCQLPSGCQLGATRRISCVHSNSRFSARSSFRC